PYGSAARCSTVWILLLRGSRLTRCPFHRAGFSPLRCPMVAAQSKTASTRLRTLDAVTVFECQIGCSTFKTSPTSIWCTAKSPKRGYTYLRSDSSHCFAYLALVQAAR